MIVIPAINCQDFECVRKRFSQIEELGANWAHVDVSDGKFSPARTWNEPAAISNLPPEARLAKGGKSQISNLNIEVHLMVEAPEKHVERWAEAGARRIIVHVETVDRERLREILESLPEEIELGLAIGPGTENQDVWPYLDEVRFVQFLSVNPGFSGQKFQDEVIGKIKELKRHDGGVTIEVDGGVDLNVARLVKAAGAQVIVSASYLWESIEPKGAYENLMSV